MTNNHIVASNIEKIASLFPGCVTECADNHGNKARPAIDFEKLKAELGADIADSSAERYQFTWPDKRAAIRLANTPTTMTLRPCREESVDFDNTQNLYIEGDNLDALKVIRENYLGKVKLIYIDPPYNTGHDFVYKDNFIRSVESFEQTSRIFDEEGNQIAEKLLRNTNRNGRFHTDWLNMIYPRLKVARDLLSDDGIIFISIDHNEAVNLGKIADEIFGIQNRVGLLSVINNMKGRSDDKFFATCNDFALVYVKNYNISTIGGFDLDDEELDSDYSEQDDIGCYKLIGFRKTGNAWRREERPDMFYPVLYKNEEYSTISYDEQKRIYVNNRFDDDYVNLLTEKYTLLGYRVIWPTTSEGEYGRWRWGKKKFIDEKDINFDFNGNGTLCTKMRANIEDGSIRIQTAKTLWYKPEYDTGSSKTILKKLFGKNDIFNNPKSLVYLKDVIRIATDKDSIILDFFSGSGTTAHASMMLNSEDSGNRKFIMVQLPEDLDNSLKTADKDAKVTIENAIKFLDSIQKPHLLTEIGKERLRRAGANILAAPEMQGRTPDVGFRVLKLDSSNMADVYYSPQESGQQTLFVENVKPNRSSEDLLFQVMLDLGIELSAKIDEKQIAGKTVHFVDENYLVACFDSNINESTIKEIAKLRPVYFVMRDASVENDNVIDNFEQIFKHYSPDTTCRII